MDLFLRLRHLSEGLNFYPILNMFQFLWVDDGGCYLKKNLNQFQVGFWCICMV